MATMTVKDATGATEVIEKPLTPGAAAAASSRPVALSTEDQARQGAIAETAPASDTASSGLNGRLQRIAQRLTTLIATVDQPAEFEAVAASQVAQVLGTTGAIGDLISHVTVTPETTSPGAITLTDNATPYIIFVGGATSVSNLVPFTIELGMKSVSGAWKITTGANVHLLAVGNFT